MPKPLKEGRVHSSPRCRKVSYEKISHKYGNSRNSKHTLQNEQAKL